MMRTAFGKLAMLAFVLLTGILLLSPMRAGIEDVLSPNVRALRMNIGDSYEISYHIKAEKYQTVSFRSENPVVAEVTSRGEVKAVTPGKTKITLSTQGGATASVNVEVAGVPVTSIALNTKLLEMDKGSVSGLEATLNEGATDQRIEWLSADSNIAKVDRYGRVLAVGAGETYIVATTPTGYTAAATVRVRVLATAVDIVPDGLTFGVGSVLQLKPHFLPEDSTELVDGWKSSHPEVATVDKDGVIRAISPGKTTIKVTTEEGNEGIAEVTVEPAAKAFQLNPTTATIERGTTLNVEPIFFNENDEPDPALKHHIEWVSSDPRVATVSEGEIVGVSAGRARITATADGMTAVINIKVAVSVKTIELNETEMYLLREQTGEPIQLSALIFPIDAENPRVTYSTSNSLVATVTQDGLVSLTGGYGTAVITASNPSGAEAAFTVHIVTQLPAEPPADGVEAGEAGDTEPGEAGE